MNKLRVIDIVPGTSVDGPGLRTSIYFAGCSHHCPECHNPQSWDFGGGTEMTVEEVLALVKEHDFNVTLTGGDPLQQPADALALLTRAIKDAGYTVWCYTGYRYEDIADRPELQPVFENLEALVDGPFIAAERDISLQFRGSRNQRIIYL